MELQLEAVSQSIRRARTWVRHATQVTGAPPATVRTAELLTSELVTNAIKYGPPGGDITLRARRDGAVLDVSVTDDSHQPPLLKNPPPSESGGRGIRIVAALSSDWGVRLHHGNGKSVWFRLPLEPQVVGEG